MEALRPLVTLASFSVKNSTPLLLGGYDTYACHGRELGCEPLRSQSLKGVVRWWSRAALAGRLYSLNVRGRELVSGVESAEARIWGSTKSVSPIIVRTRGVLKPTRCDRLAVHSRYKLLRLGRAERGKSLCGFLEEGGIYVQRFRWMGLSRELVNHVVLSFISMLWLGGLGKGSRRGLGSLDILDSRNIYRDYTRPDKIVEVLKLLVDSSTGLVGRYSAGEDGRLPSIPAIAEGVFRLFRCDVEDPLRAAIAFSQCVMGRSMRDKSISWVFGLPRRGYSVRGVERRASPVMFSVHRGVGFISAFYSSDWPREIRHYRNSISISDDVIRQSMDKALEHLVQCLSRENITCREVEVW